MIEREWGAQDEPRCNDHIPFPIKEHTHQAREIQLQDLFSFYGKYQHTVTARWMT